MNYDSLVLLVLGDRGGSVSFNAEPKVEGLEASHATAGVVLQKG